VGAPAVAVGVIVFAITAAVATEDDLGLFGQQIAVMSSCYLQAFDCVVA
jgi:hypothetical protein